MPLFDDPNDPTGGATDALREFESALADASAELAKIEAGGGGGGDSTGTGGGKAGILGRLKKGALGVAAVVGAAAIAGTDSYLQGAIAGGTTQSGVGNLNRGLISAVGKIPILGALTGASATARTLGRAEGRVGGGLADLARQGIAVSDEMIQGELDVVIAQEKRATEVEARVRGATGRSDNVSGATPDGAAGIVRLVELVESIADSVIGITGGSPR